MQILRKYGKIIGMCVVLVTFFIVAGYAVSHVEEGKGLYQYEEKLFTKDVVHEIDIQIDAANWQDMLDNPLDEEMHQANVVIDGETVGNIGIRTKGNTSLTSVANMDSDRYSFKIDFDYYESSTNYYGLQKLNLNNNFSDNTYMKEYISYEILGEMGLPTPAHSYAHITVNGEEWGLYLAVEAVDEAFIAQNFDDTTGDLYKPDGSGATLAYVDEKMSSYSGLTLKTNENSSDGSKIIALMKALQDGEGLEEVLDVDETLRYIAVNVALANFDSYLGGTTHNYYLYEDDGKFSIIPWDYNLAFGGFGGGTVDIYDPASSAMGFGGRGMEMPEGMTFPDDMEMPEGMTFPDDMEMPEDMTFPDDMEMPDGMTPPEGMDGQMGGGGNNEQEQRTDNQEQGQAQTRALTQTQDAVATSDSGQAEDGRENQDDRMGMGGSDNSSKPLVSTLLANEEYLAEYESYLNEITQTYLTEAYMTQIVSETYDLIAPFVEQDATAFYIFAEFQAATSTSQDDNQSLVYFAVNMAADIQNQLAGGEASFSTNSFQGSSMMGGGGMGGGFFKERKSSTEGAEKTTTDGESMTGENAPDSGVGSTAMNAFGEKITDEDVTNESATNENPSNENPSNENPSNESAPGEDAFTDRKTMGGGPMGQPPNGGMGGGMGRDGGQDSMSEEEIQTALMQAGMAGGIFIIGFACVVGFRRKRMLK